MKINLLIIVVFLTFLVNVSAQDTTKTLLNLISPLSVGLYIAPEIGFGQLRGSLTGFGGVSAMAVLNKRWNFGGSIQMNITDNYVPKAIRPLSIAASLLSGRIEYTPDPNALVHVSFPLSVGIGEASTDSVGNDNHQNYEGNKDDGQKNASTFIVISPGIRIETNLIRYAKLFIGIDYHLSFIADNKNSSLPGNTFQGIYINAGLKVGLFEYKLHRKSLQVSNTF